MFSMHPIGNIGVLNSIAALHLLFPFSQVVVCSFTRVFTQQGPFCGVWLSLLFEESYRASLITKFEHFIIWVSLKLQMIIWNFQFTKRLTQSPHFLKSIAVPLQDPLLQLAVVGFFKEHIFVIAINKLSLNHVDQICCLVLQSRSTEIFHPFHVAGLRWVQSSKFFSSVDCDSRCSIAFHQCS